MTNKPFKIKAGMTFAEANEISTILDQYTDYIKQADDLRDKLEEMRERLGVEL